MTFLAGALPDLRGWEWHYVHSLLQPWERELEADAPILDTVTYGADGKRLFAVLVDGTLGTWDVSTGVFSRP